ncbi:hypothetical protein Tco_0127080 [Tanacetum coccineum]
MLSHPNLANPPLEQFQSLLTTENNMYKTAGTVLLTPLPPGKSNNAYKSSQGHLSSRHGLTLKKFKKDAPCQAFKNQERHRLKGESSPSQRLKGESSPSPLLILTCRSQQHLGRAFT